MHNTLVMGVLQRTQNLRSKVQGVIPGDGPLLLYIFLSGNAVHILHHNVLELLAKAHIVHLYDIGVGHNGNGLGLVLEPAHKVVILQKLVL